MILGVATNGIPVFQIFMYYAVNIGLPCCIFFFLVDFVGTDWFLLQPMKHTHIFVACPYFCCMPILLLQQCLRNVVTFCARFWHLAKNMLW
jgi:hypothetical protein